MSSQKRSHLNMVAAPAVNHHALVAKDDLDSKSYIPEYDSREYMKWCNKFTVAAPERVSQIIGGQLTTMEVVVCSTSYLSTLPCLYCTYYM